MVKSRNQIHFITTKQTSLKWMGGKWITSNNILKVRHDLIKGMR